MSPTSSGLVRSLHHSAVQTFQNFWGSPQNQFSKMQSHQDPPGLPVRTSQSSHQDLPVHPVMCWPAAWLQVWCEHPAPDWISSLKLPRQQTDRVSMVTGRKGCVCAALVVSDSCSFMFSPSADVISHQPRSLPLGQSRTTFREARRRPRLCSHHLPFETHHLWSSGSWKENKCRKSRVCF